MRFRLYGDSSRPYLNILRTFCERSKTRTVSKKYANNPKYYRPMDGAHFFSTETITVPLSLRLFAIAK